MAAQKLTAHQQRLVEKQAKQVTSLARALAPRTPHASVEELESAGFEGLVQAALRFDPTTGVLFKTFAHYRVRGAMIDAARDAAPEIRRRSRAMRVLQTTQALLEHARTQQPRAEDGDQRSLQERVQAAADLVARTTAAVIMSKVAPRAPDTVAARNGDAETELLEREERKALATVMDSCDDQEKAILDALYFRGLSMGEYAREVGKNKSTVSRHHARLMDRLAKRMKALLRGAKLPSGEP
jgi:RNA polymerase sigma factor for flagellar operon FliA